MTKAKASASTDPVEAEATPGSTLKVVWDGHDYTVPGSLDDCPIEVFEALRRNDMIAYIALTLGADQWSALKRVSKPKAGDRHAIADAITAAFGLGTAGE